MSELSQLAAQAASFFRVCMHPTHGEVTMLKKGAPGWLVEAVAMTHLGFTLDGITEPDLFKYQAAHRAFEAIAANPNTDLATLEVRFTTNTNPCMCELVEWLASHPARWVYCDQALEHHPTPSTSELLGQAQRLERKEIFSVIRAALQSQIHPVTP